MGDLDLWGSLSPSGDKLPQRSIIHKWGQTTPEVKLPQRSDGGMEAGMNDYLRESLSYFGLYRRMFESSVAWVGIFPTPL